MDQPQNQTRQHGDFLSLEGITKAYPGVLANDAVSFSVAKGEIHALLGENGAGKSTLVKVLYGLVAPDAGQIQIEGKPVHIANPVAARKLGIGMVFQHFSLFESQTVLENIALGLKGERASKSLAKRVAKVSSDYGLDLDPDRSVLSLSVGEKQRVEIARTLLQDPQLLVLDEPTSVLTPQEADQLFKTLRRFADEGRSIIYISHKLDEIKALCQRATVMRAGKVIGTFDAQAETAESLAEKMIGKRVEQKSRTKTAERGKPLLELNAEPFGQLKLHAGEILGIAGVAGNGQEDLMAFLCGEAPTKTKNQLLLNGEDISRLSPQARRRKDLRVLPEERIGHAAVAGLSLAQNVFLTRFQESALSRFKIPTRWLKRQAISISQNFDVRHSGVDATMGSLSGGNMQKFIVGREVETNPRVFVVSQPTWGVDKGAAARIHEAMEELASKGAGVLVISQDLDELLALCDRIHVMFMSKLSAAKPTEDWSVADLGLEMAGSKQMGSKQMGSRQTGEAA